ncbi:hypothetical protein [Nocardia sp. NPDC050435]|uniref:hypothetical protein n=1 Tax=Nocardia sp. NPDC050435 TaxID=3155040 RepID=UPI0033CD791E
MTDESAWQSFERLRWKGDRSDERRQLAPAVPQWNRITASDAINGWRLSGPESQRTLTKRFYSGTATIIVLRADGTLRLTISNSKGRLINSGLERACESREMDELKRLAENSLGGSQDASEENVS